ncbi:hypothetical protein Tco_0393596 [Tanacetum coccineum]
MKTSKRNDTGSPKCVQARECTRRKATWFRSIDGKKRRREFVLYGSNLGSIGRNYTRRFQDVKLARIYIDEIIARNGILVMIKLRLIWMIYLVVLVDAAESVRDAIRFDYHLSIRSALFEALYGRKCRSPILWAEIGESSLTGLELVQETTDKVVLVKEKPKAARDHQKSYVNFRSKPLEFEILERISLVAYRLRLPEELNSVHATFHVSSLKKCLADASLHVPLNEIKVDKILHFVEELVEIMDQEIKKLKHRKIVLVKVRWNSKCGPEFTWEHEDQIRIKNWKLRFEHSAKSGGLLASISGLLSGRRVTCEYLRSELEGKWNWIDPRAIEVFSMSSSSKSPHDYLQKYQRAILESWRLNHGLPPSPPSPPPTGTSLTSPILNDSLTYSLPLQNSTPNLNEIHHLSNLLDINLQRAIEATNPSPPTSQYIPPPSLEQVNFHLEFCHCFLDTQNLFDTLKDDLNRIKSLIIGPSTQFPSSITTSSP